MKPFRRWLCVLLCCLMLTPSALADEMFDDWYRFTSDMVSFGTRQRRVLDNALWYVWDEWSAQGYELWEGTLNEQLVSNSSNIEAILKAKNEKPQIIVVGAHIDSLSPGARDNSSGVGAVMAMLEAFTAQGGYENTEIRFAIFTEEETGHYGSKHYVKKLSRDEKQRVIAMFNVDILAVGMEDSEQTALSCDTLGMRIENGYQQGSEDTPACNRAALAILKAMQEVGGFPPEDENVQWCGPRHLGMSDHQSFHEAGIDSVNFCFRGNPEEGGNWPQKMHQPDDNMENLDLERTQQALQVLYTAIDGLASDHAYAL